MNGSSVNVMLNSAVTVNVCSLTTWIQNVAITQLSLMFPAFNSAIIQIFLSVFISS